MNKEVPLTFNDLNRLIQTDRDYSITAIQNSLILLKGKLINIRKV